MHKAFSLLLSGLLTIVTTGQSSQPKPIFGVIEGYYGKPLTLERRISLVKTLGRCGLGLYIVAPKLDTYHRIGWRNPPPKTYLADFEKLGAECKKAGVGLCTSLSPGLSLKEREIPLLCERAKTLCKNSPNFFALLFDDIPQKPDAALGKLHAKTGNAVFTALQKAYPKMRMFLCPTQYYDIKATPYITQLALNLDKRVMMFWTGPEIVPAQVPLSDFLGTQKTFRHKAMLWDNFPVNDFQKNKLWLGPYLDRPEQMLTSSGGIVLNISEQSELSKIAISRFADWVCTMPCGSNYGLLVEELSPTFKENVKSLVKLFDVPPGRKRNPLPELSKAFWKNPKSILTDLDKISKLTSAPQKLLREDAAPWARAAAELAKAIRAGKKDLWPYLKLFAPLAGN